MPHPNPMAVLTLITPNGAKAGEERMRLLEQIAMHGSITAAAKNVGISYKAAWDAVKVMNNLFPAPLVLTQPGGRTGGGAQLTDEGRQVIDLFHSVKHELDRVMEQFSQHMRLADPNAKRSTLIWSNAMRTSARNTFRGTVTAVTPGAVNAEVVLRISEQTEIVAIITNHSVETLKITPESEVFAMIKSSFVILAPESEAQRTSARNRLCGTVIEVMEGAVNDEVVLDLGGGRTITAIITKASVENLGFKVGERACALVKASHIILAVE
ncbi:transcriptional regulator, ModE family [Magnetococcus marinus MC-1]|uniref:Transcriptional regulator, ModE family n=1 Tax=Magnetococcus marinus (strain ATCC BAA-1437 / JCM 17883 / MC-1) TaxID=156889 RepID=A0L8E6_MAGMM|nr:TOBE domain-containing protein [Magnetococcus marinus]ABK44239.1 transcriptional regulator, ModE family [Magnetococcus marinus MC-1]